MTEWVKEDNWGAVKEGYRVRVERDDACAEFVVDEVALSGNWVDGMGKYFVAAEGWTLYVPARPLTRLEPVPITAKKVLDALIEEFGADPKNSYIAECAGRVAAEFGVTTDEP